MSVVNHIRNVRWRVKGTKGVIDFDYNGEVITISEPKDVILSDDDASRRWIAVRYGFLLGFL